MKQTRILMAQSGFALPTVLISSVVMLIVLLSGLVSSSSVNVSLRSQYQDKVLKEALEAGTIMANMCLSKNNQVASWNQGGSTGATLAPNTDCKGNAVSGASQYVLDAANLKTGFTVGSPVTSNGTQRVDVTATLYGVRTSGGAPVSQRTMSSSSIVGGQTTFGNTIFGYSSGLGAFFATIFPNGSVKSLGYNGNGQLGDGTTNNAISPTTFTLPAGQVARSGYSNFLSEGSHMFVITADGSLYGAGKNDVGQLGTWVTGPSFANPSKYLLPTGVKAQFVSTAGPRTFVIGDDSNIYASGSCDYGQLGTGTNCTFASTPIRVALPTVNTSNLNTVPETDPKGIQPRNLVTDFFATYALMKGGDVYVWGTNGQGQYGDGTTTAVSGTKKVAAVSSFSTPPFTQVATDGVTAFLIDNVGTAWVTGQNSRAGAGGLVRNKGNMTACMRKDSNGAAAIYAAGNTCNANDGWQFMEFWPDGTWRFRTDSRTYGPTDSMLCATAPTALGGIIEALTCDGSARQQWLFSSENQTIISTLYNACVEPNNNLYMVSCRASSDGLFPYQQWTVDPTLYLRPIPRPPGNVAYKKITTDNASIHLLDANGDVWAAGSNNRGQLGTGRIPSLNNNVLIKVTLPSGLKAVDIYNTSSDPYGSTTGINTGSATNNTFFIMSDGSVYGTGANNYGQLGNGSAADYTTVPVKMNLPSGITAKSVQSGFGTTIVLSSDGRVFTMGNNSNGQLGDNTTTNSSTPKANNYTNQRQAINY